jgi:hypothetical protein
MLYAKPREHPNGVATLSIVILFSARVNFAPPAVQFLLSQPQQGDLVGHHQRHSKVLEKIYQPSYELRYRRNTSHLKQ